MYRNQHSKNARQRWSRKIHSMKLNLNRDKQQFLSRNPWLAISRFQSSNWHCFTSVWPMAAAVSVRQKNNEAHVMRHPWLIRLFRVLGPQASFVWLFTRSADIILDTSVHVTFWSMKLSTNILHKIKKKKNVNWRIGAYN